MRSPAGLSSGSLKDLSHLWYSRKQVTFQDRGVNLPRRACDVRRPAMVHGAALANPIIELREMSMALRLHEIHPSLVHFPLALVPAITSVRPSGESATDDALYPGPWVTVTSGGRAAVMRTSAAGSGWRG